MRKSIILAVVLMVALVAVPAMASTQNVKVSGSVDSTYLYRENFDLGDNDLGNDVQSLFMTQTTLQVDADLTDQVSATIALINERAWGDVPDDNNTDIDLNLAYVTLREMLYSPLTVVVGRQNFSYGNSLIIDSAGPNTSAPADSGIASVAGDLTKQTAQDAIRLIFDYNPLTMEVLYSKINSRTLTAVEAPDDDVDLYGVNATYELGDDYNTMVEAYFFAQIDRQNRTSTTSKSDTIYVPGLRASADILDGLNVQGELALQRGNRVNATSGAENDNQKRTAMAAQIISNYQVPNDLLPDGLEEYNPALQYVYTYVSGDSNPNDESVDGDSSVTQNEWTAWDPMYENQAGGKIYNALFSLTNSHIHSVKATINPLEDVTTSVSWTGIWLDKDIDPGTNGSLTLLQPDGTTVDVNNYATDEDEVGYEIDLDAIYDYTEDVQIGATLGWFIPGDVFTDSAITTGSDDIASQAMIHGIVNF